MTFVENGSIKPVIFKEKYDGLSSIPRALEDLKGRKTWGRAVLTINEQAENEQAAKL
jgi:D-arabinose 1-dehydrogenase-like Zn-dependent alcohol dehydrogenase